MSSEFVNKILKDLEDDLENDRLVLPSIPEIALKVRDATDNPDITSNQLAEIISQDASLATKLVQLANSPLLRGSKNIDSLDLAITRMGNSMVKNCVQSIIVKQLFTPSTEASKKLFHDFMQHSADVAALSFTLAKIAKVKPDEALLAGLVHDIGALPIIKRAEEIPELINNETALYAAITELHTTFGKELLTKWDFPQEITDVVAEHEDLKRDHDGAADLVDVVIAANLQNLADKAHRHSLVDWETVPAMKKLGFINSASMFEEYEEESVSELSEVLL